MNDKTVEQLISLKFILKTKESVIETLALLPVAYCKHYFKKSSSFWPTTFHKTLLRHSYFEFQRSKFGPRQLNDVQHAFVIFQKLFNLFIYTDMSVQANTRTCS